MGVADNVERRLFGQVWRGRLFGGDVCRGRRRVWDGGGMPDGLGLGGRLQENGNPEKCEETVRYLGQQGMGTYAKFEAYLWVYQC